MELTNSRARILDAAKALFVARGYRGLSMRELGEAVGVSKAAIYYHFRDKEALFLALVADSLGELEAIIVATRAERAEFRAQVRRIALTILKLPMEERAMIRVAMQEMTHLSEAAQQTFLQEYHRRFIGQLQALFEQGIAAGHFRTVAPATATWTLLGMMYPHFYGGEPSPAGAATDEQIHEMLAIFFDGVCTPSSE